MSTPAPWPVCCRSWNSSTLLTRVVRAEGLAERPEFGDPAPSLLQAYGGWIPFLQPTPRPPDTAEARELRTLQRLRRAVKVTRVGITYVIKVDVSLPSPGMAQRVARAVGDAYLADQLEAKYQLTRRDARWLSERLTDLRDEVKRSEEEVEHVRQHYNLTETDHAQGSTVARQQITELNSELLRAEEEVASRQARYQQAERIQRSEGNLEGLTEVSASHVIESLRQKQSELNQRLADLTTRYAPNSPNVIRAETERRSIDRAIGAEVSRIVASLRNDYKSALAQRKTLQEQLSRLTTGEGGAANSDGEMKLREAQRVVQVNRGVYKAFLAICGSWSSSRRARTLRRASSTRQAFRTA